MPELRLTATTLTHLRQHLLQADGRERVAIAYCTASGDDFLVADVHPVGDADHAVSTDGACRPTDSCIRDHVGQAVEQDKHLFIPHSHPFADTAAFSTRDRQIMESYRDWLQPLYPDTQLLFGVLGREALAAGQVAKNGTVRSLPVEVVGDWTLDPPLDTSLTAETATAASAQPAVDWQRNDRTIRALGLAGHQALADTHVAVVGVGGVGSWLAASLARMGIRRLTLVDHDDVERSNLPRIAGARPGDVGEPKVRVIQQQCLAATPECEVTTVSTRAQDAGDQLQDADILVGCVDTVTARYWLNEFAVRHLIPYIDLGTVIALTTDEEAVESEETYLQTIVPGVTACFDCLKRGDPEQARIEQLSDEELAVELNRGYVAGTDLTPEPAVLPLNLSVVSDGLYTVVDLVTGHQPPPGLLRSERRQTEREAIITTPRESCPTCGEDGITALGDHTPSAGDRSVDPDESNGTEASDEWAGAVEAAGHLFSDT